MNKTDKLADELNNEFCRDFRLIEGGTLILFFGDELSTESSCKRLWIDCAWRLRDQSDMVVVGSLDESQSILEKLQAVRNQALTEISLAKPTNDLRVAFANGFAIDIFCYSIADEQWEYRSETGVRIGVGPGLNLYSRMATSDS